MRLFIIYSVYLLVIFVISAYTGVSAAREESKRSRYGMLYLSPSSRVGRLDNRWNDIPGTSKRKISKLMAFPRVGRGNSKTWLQNDDVEYDTMSKRTAAGTGMWFGPRLGRLQKRDAMDRNHVPRTYIILGDDITSRGIDYTPRLGRESEETYDETDINASLLPDSP